MNASEVRFDASRTINLGNYESVKVSVGVSAPVGQRSLDEAYEAARDWVLARLEEEVATWKM